MWGRGRSHSLPETHTAEGTFGVARLPGQGMKEGLNLAYSDGQSTLKVLELRGLPR